MKLLIILFMSVIAFQFTAAQTTVTHPPSVGDRYISRACDTNNIFPGNTGSNQTWDYSGLILLPDSSETNWINVSGTPFASNYPNATIVSKDIENEAYSYYTYQSGSVLYYGTSMTGLEEILTEPGIHYKYPFSYGDSYTDNFSGTVQNPGFVFQRNGTITSTADAWGTIILPAGTFSNALRVRVEMIMRDSVSTPMPMSVVTEIVNYLYYVPDLKYPIFRLTYSSTTSIAGTELARHVSYSPNQTVGINQISSTVPESFNLSQNFPNPFNPVTKIHFSVSEQTNVKLTIYDMLGRQVAVLVDSKVAPGVYETQWNASGFNSGVYFYNLQTGTGINSTRKMILAK